MYKKNVHRNVHMSVNLFQAESCSMDFDEILHVCYATEGNPDQYILS
jgi:hypothetical protein